MRNRKREYERKRNRKIIFSLLMILFVGLVLTSSVYAWFTANQTVTVNQIDVNVAAQNGLQVSTNASTWKTIISNQDLIDTTNGTVDTLYSTNNNMIPFKANGAIVPVSTIGEVDPGTGYLKMFAGSISNNALSGAQELTTSVANETKGQSGQFIAFDLFFKVDTKSQVYLTPSSSVKAFDGEADKGLKNAARVAWISQGTKAAGTGLAEIQGQKAQAATQENLIIWEPNSDVHTAAAVQNAQSTYSVTTTATSAATITYKGVKAAITNAVPVASTDAQYFADLKGSKINSPAAGVPGSTKWFNLDAGITKVRFYLWIEGQDVDCENTASGSSISYNMQFSLLPN